MVNETQGQDATPEFTVQGSKLSPREQFYYEQGFKEPVDSITRIEETAKLLLGTITACAGVLLTSLKIIVSVDENTSFFVGSWVVIGCWAVALMFLVNVVTPLPWKTRVDDPTSLESTYRTIRKSKAMSLWIGVVLFVFGLFAGLILVAR